MIGRKEIEGKLFRDIRLMDLATPHHRVAGRPGTGGGRGLGVAGDVVAVARVEGGARRVGLAADRPDEDGKPAAGQPAARGGASRMPRQR